MNLDQAKRVLDEHKERQCHTMRTVNKALFICGDLREVDESLFEAGKETRMESTDMVDCPGLGR